MSRSQITGVKSAGKKHTKTSISKESSTTKNVIAGSSGNTTAAASTTAPKAVITTAANAASTTAVTVQSTATVQQQEIPKTVATVVASTTEEAKTGSHKFGCAVHIRTLTHDDDVLHDLILLTRTGIVVIGMVTHAEAARNDTMGRDQARIVRLRAKSNAVFSLASHNPSNVRFDPVFHVPHKMSKRGAKALVKKMDEYDPKLRLGYICLDYCRFPKGYYQALVCGEFEKKHSQAGKPMIAFVTELKEKKKLAAGCRLIFVRTAAFDRFENVLENLSMEVDGSSRFIPASYNPLYRASEEVERAGDWTCDRTYHHQDEVEKHMHGIKYVFYS